MSETPKDNEPENISPPWSGPGPDERDPVSLRKAMMDAYDEIAAAPQTPGERITELKRRREVIIENNGSAEELAALTAELDQVRREQTGEGQP